MLKKHVLKIRLAGIVIASGLISCAETVKPGVVNSDKGATATASAQGTTEPEKTVAKPAATKVEPASDWMLGSALKINFQKADSATPEGYLADVGEAFGDRKNGFSYGWNFENTDATRDRNSAEADDPRYHTFNHLQKDDANPAVWEIELPTGVYGVHLVAGEPSHTDQINTIDLEGQRLTDDDGEDEFDEYDVFVQISDGRLTLKAAEGAANAKVAFIEITPRELTPRELTLEVEDFTLTEATVRNLPEAGGGKAVALLGENSSASRTIQIAAGSYELYVFIRGTDSEQDAIFVTIAGTEYRFYNDDHGVLGPATSNDGDPVVVSIPADGKYSVTLTFAEPGVLIDRLVLKGR